MPSNTKPRLNISNSEEDLDNDQEERKPLVPIKEGEKDDESSTNDMSDTLEEPMSLYLRGWICVIYMISASMLTFLNKTIYSKF